MVPTVPTQGLVCTNIFPSTHLHLHLDVHLGAHRDVDRGPGGVGVVDVPHQVGLRVPNVKNKPGNRHKGVRDGCETDHTRPNACQILWTAPCHSYIACLEYSLR